METREIESKGSDRRAPLLNIFPRVFEPFASSSNQYKSDYNLIFTNTCQSQGLFR